MPYINIQYYPKNLSKQAFATFIDELGALTQKHLKATNDVISIAYTETAPRKQGEVYAYDIKPNRATLEKSRWNYYE